MSRWDGQATDMNMGCKNPETKPNSVWWVAWKREK
jgi:hypothetical protein